MRRPRPPNPDPSLVLPVPREWLPASGMMAPPAATLPPAPSPLALVAEGALPAASAAEVAAVVIERVLAAAPTAAAEGVARVAAEQAPEGGAPGLAAAQAPQVLQPREAAVLAESRAAQTPFQSTPHLAALAPKGETRPRPGPRRPQRAVEPRPIRSQDAGTRGPTAACGFVLPHRGARQVWHHTTVADHPILERYNVSPQTIIILPGGV
jgi:hypothetical protein